MLPEVVGTLGNIKSRNYKERRRGEREKKKEHINTKLKSMCQVTTNKKLDNN